MSTNPVSLLRLGSLVVTVGIAACDASPGYDTRAPEPIGLASSAVVTAGLFSTGVDANGAGRTPTNGTLRDLHYELVASTDPTIQAALPMAPFVVQADSQTAAQWAANTAAGEWISAFPNTRAGPASRTYTYETTFTIPAGFDPAKVVLTGAWACDDECTVTLGLNGPVVASNTIAGTSTPASTLRPFAIAEGSFASRSVTLDFVVSNTNGFETGLLVTGYGGCRLDSQCRGTEFCDTQNGPCVDKLVNGASVPTLTGHTPPLAGTCPSDPDAGGAVGAAICASGVCDPTSGECGLANNHGPCATGDVCQSGVCESDGLCGYRDGDGPCIGGDGGTDAGTGAVCRSGVCNALGTCGNLPEAGADASAEAQVDSAADAQVDSTLEAQADAAADAPDDLAVATQDDGAGDAQDDLAVPAQDDGTADAQDELEVVTDAGATADALAEAEAEAGAVPEAGSTADAGCSVDSDCTATQYCDTPTSTCAAKLPNGQGVPHVAGHNPAVTGTCSAAVGAVICASGVCDTSDNECGLANGDGPCSHADAGVAVCRSGTCLTTAVCGPQAAPGCTVDADCSSTQWCDTSRSTCAPKLTNGKQVPSVAGHAPALAGRCTVGVGAAVCLAGVCDTVDNACGYASGDGPCTTAESSACRSGTCLLPEAVCGEAFVASGNGVSCSFVAADRVSHGAIGVIGIGIAAAFGWARRRRMRSTSRL